MEIDFTIVTPSYNYYAYIREMLESVVTQEGVTVEHLIYDAGSTDGTLDIIAEYDHVQLIVEPDKGMSEAINKGFKAAKGKWVMWLNTDDRLKPGALSKVKAIAEEYADADVLYGAWDFIDGAGVFQKRMQAFPFQKMMLAHYGCYIASTATFFRKRTVMDKGYLLNDRFKYVMDGEYYNRLAAAGLKFQYFQTLVADFRMHGENLSQKYLGAVKIDALLDRELMFAESRSIRRKYGFTPFSDYHLTSLVDALLFHALRLQKGFLKVMYPAKE